MGAGKQQTIMSHRILNHSNPKLGMLLLILINTDVHVIAIHFF